MSAKRSSPRAYPAAFALLVLFCGVGLVVTAKAASAGASARPPMSGFSAGAYVSSQPGGYFIQASAPLTTPTPPAGPPDLVAVIYQMNCDGPTLALITMNTRIPRPVNAPSTMRLTNSVGDFVEFPVPAGFFYTHQEQCRIGTCVTADWANALPFTLTVDYYNTVVEESETNNSSVLATLTPCQTTTPVATFTRTPTPTSTRIVDLAGIVTWTNTCTATVILRMQTYIVGPTFMRTAVPSTMRAQNSQGDTFDVAVPQLDVNRPSYTFDCVLGSCLPTSWATAIPITLTVDYFNQVFEHDETNNVSIMPFPPPLPTPCPPNTVTPTNTPTSPQLPTYTFTATGSPTVSPTPCPMNFSDVHPTDYFYEAVRYLFCDGDISGYADGTFRPFNNVTRCQTVKIVVLGFNIPIYVPPPPCTFWDACTENPFYSYIETAAYHELISGYADGSFRPFNPVTRAQTAKIVVMAAVMVRGWTIVSPITPTFSDVPPDNSFYPFIETATCYGIITGYANGTFRPFNQATRGQISKIVHLGFTGNLSCAGPFEPQNRGELGLLHASSLAHDYEIEASVPLTTPTPAYTRTFTPTPTMTPSHTPTYTETATATSTASHTITPCPMNFSDVRSADYFYEAVRYLYCEGTVSGYADGTFRPYNSVTQAQTMKMLVLAFDVPIYVPPGPSFCEVESTHPFYIYITSLMYYIYGGPPFECIVRPYNNMTRGHFARAVVGVAERALGWKVIYPPVPTFSDVPTQHTFYAAIETAYCYGVINGYADGTYRPNNLVTRGQASKIIHRTIAGGTTCVPSMRGDK